MGAWGVGPFDNDAAGDALDKVAAADSSDRIQLISESLARIADAPGRLDSGETDEALALAALVAASAGAPEAQHDDATEFLSNHRLEPGRGLRELALRTIDRALTAENNEWYELWVKSNGLSEARRELAPFREALHKSLSP